MKCVGGIGSIIWGSGGPLIMYGQGAPKFCCLCGSWSPCHHSHWVLQTRCVLENKMKLNDDKSVLLLIGTSSTILKTPVSFEDIYFGTISINYNKKAKKWGVNFDNYVIQCKVSWRSRSGGLF